MPNWVYNTLSVSGSKDSIAKLVEQLSKPVTTHHEELKVIDGKFSSEKGTQVSEEAISFMNIIAPSNLDAYYSNSTPSIDVTDTENIMSSIVHALNTGEDWYNWNVRNWGCKWDASSISAEVNDTDVVYRFETPWSPPEQAMITLSEQHPDLNFFLRYEEEQGWGAEVQFTAGEYYITEQWDIPTSHSDYVDRNDPANCICNWQDEEEWFDDCPRLTVDVNSITIPA